MKDKHHVNLPLKKERKKKEYVVLEVRDNVQMYSAAAFKGSLHTPQKGSQRAKGIRPILSIFLSRCIEVMQRKMIKEEIHILSTKGWAILGPS